jgi:hypothetical protein
MYSSDDDIIFCATEQESRFDCEKGLDGEDGIELDNESEFSSENLERDLKGSDEIDEEDLDTLVKLNSGTLGKLYHEKYLQCRE